MAGGGEGDGEVRPGGKGGEAHALPQLHMMMASSGSMEVDPIYARLLRSYLN